MTEFRTRPGKLLPGSMDDFGNILGTNGFGEEKVAFEGYVQINSPVSRRRWDTYCHYGWKPVRYALDAADDTVTGILFRGRRLPFLAPTR